MTGPPAGSPPVAGRALELAAAAAAIGAGTGVVFAGPHGVGKTYLGREVTNRLAAAGHRVTWVAGTRAAASIPFGPFVRFLDGAVADDPTSQLRHLLDVLGPPMRSPAAGCRPVLFVDDAHLLDAASATVVHHLALSGAVILVLSVTTGRACPDAVSRTWRDGFAAVVEVADLDETGSADLLAAVLEGAVDPGTVSRMHELTAGSPLALRELAAGAQAGGSLTLVDEVWCWDGAWRTTTRLLATVNACLDGCDAAARDALRYVALAQPLATDVLCGLTTADVVESLCELGLLRCDPSGRTVTLGYRLYGEVLLRSSQPPTRRRLRRALAGGLDGRGDLLTRATLLLDAGDRPPDTDLVVAANEAVTRLDADLAERLATAADPATPGRALALARALSLAGRFDRVDAVLGEAETRARAAVASSPRADLSADGTPGTTGPTPQGPLDLDLAVARLVNYVRGLRRSDLAESYIRQTANRIGNLPHEITRVLRIYLATLTRRYADAAAACTDDPLLSDVTVDGPAGWAVYQLAGAYFQLGRAQDCLDLLLHHDRPDAPPDTALALRFGIVGALVGLGRPDEAAQRADALVEWGSRTGWGPAACLGAASTGGVLVYRGSYAAAARALREAEALSARFAPGTSRHWILCQFATAEAALGNDDAARALLAQAAAYRDRLELPYLAEQERRAEAFVRACAGETSVAIRILQELIKESVDLGAWSQTVDAAHLLARLGGAREAGVAVASMPVHGPFTQACVRHICALAEPLTKAAACTAAAEEFERLGAFGLAAEAADAAADRLHRRGPHRAAGAAARTRDRLAAHGATPALRWWPSHHRGGLSPREREVAELAAAGQTSPDIAADLLLSVRTVENHLQRAYTKLGVASRAELRAVLAHQRRPRR